MILIDSLLAPTVPSAPRPKNCARTTSSGSMENAGSTADHAQVAAVLLIQRIDAIEIERLASRARFFCPIENCDAAHGHGQRVDERFCVERPVQSHLHHTDFLILRGEKIHRLMNGLAT